MIAIMSDLVSRLFENGRERSLSAEEPLFHIGDAVRFMHLVLEGRMELSRQTTTGVPVTLQAATPGHVLAEASVYSDLYHCHARAVAETRIRYVSVDDFRSRLFEDSRASENWARYLAQATQSARLRAEIRSLRTVEERIDAWISEIGSLPDKGRWTDLAAELGVSREALYRELGRRRRAGP